jgi:iron(III) transport system permease protein
MIGTARPEPKARHPGVRALARWRSRRRASPYWTVTVVAILLVLLLPVAAVLVIAVTSTFADWPHLIRNVLPLAALRTGLVLAGVGVVTLVVGVSTAWLVTIYRFAGRDILAWALLLPLAVPTYIVAYSYGGLFDFAGPLQTGLRGLLGVTSRRDYWFPEIRSVGGAVFVLSAVLYPYVYLTARASFLTQSSGTLEVARTLGRPMPRVFLEVALPLARPALVAGVALALMECLNDIGAVSYLGVRTLTLAAYEAWQQRSNLGGAAQIASLMLALVVGLFLAERIERRRRGYQEGAIRNRPPPEVELEGWPAYGAVLVCLLPVTLGFGVPMLYLGGSVLADFGELGEAAFWRAAASSLSVAALASMVTALLGLTLAYARRVAPNGFTVPAIRLAGFGYAVPGTVLAIGILVPLAGFDNWLDGWSRALLGVSTGLLLSGSLFALVLAYTVRFIAVSLGSIESGLGRISPSYDAAARTLGETAWSAFWRVHLPLLRPALGAAMLLVFVDAMKELPATLLLRPFNFETLATRIYGLAAIEQFEQAAAGALLLVLIGLAPVILLERSMRTRKVKTGPL